MNAKNILAAGPTIVIASNIAGSELNNWAFNVGADKATVATWSGISSSINLVAIPIIGTTSSLCAGLTAYSIGGSQATILYTSTAAALVSSIATIFASSEIAQHISSNTSDTPITKYQTRKLTLITVFEVATITAVVAASLAICKAAALRALKEIPAIQETVDQINIDRPIQALSRTFRTIKNENKSPPITALSDYLFSGFVETFSSDSSLSSKILSYLG